MSLWFIAWSYLWNRKFTTFLTILSVGLAVGLISSVLTLRQEAQKRFEEEGQAFDMVVGAIGSPLQLVLSSVYFMDQPVGNIPYSVYEAIRDDTDYVEAAFPIGLGDSYQGFRIVGTSVELFDHKWVSPLSFEERDPFNIIRGRAFRAPFEAVLGARVADATGLMIGDDFVGVHGFMDLPEAFQTHDHSDMPYTVVGIMAPSNSPYDRGIFVDLESVWIAHEEHDHEHGDDDHGHEHADDHGHSHDDDHGHEHDDDHGHEHDDDHGHSHDDDHGHEHDDDHGHSHDDDHGHEHEDDHGHEHDDEHGHEHDDEHGHSHDDDHGHSHDDDHGHEHEDDHGHSHDDDHGHEHDEGAWVQEVVVTRILDNAGAGENDASHASSQEVTAVLVQLHSPAYRFEYFDILRNNLNVNVAIPINEVRKLFDQFLGTAKTILMAIGYLVVVISALSILIGLYMSILQRKRDLAIMRALGASAGEIFGAVLIEAFLVTVLGILAGLAIGRAVTWGLGLFLAQRFGLVITPFGFSREEITAYCTVALIGILAGILPAWQAYHSDIAKDLADR